MSSKKLLAASILSAMLAAGAIAAIGSITTVFAQYEDDDDMWDEDAMTYGNTTTASSNTTKLSGVIASLQNNDAGAPQWITAGHWQLESDRPLFGNDTEPQVSNFSAVIYMTSITNGSNMHQHEISDFMQTSVLHSGENVTTINGTMTISMSDGPHQNTSGYMRLQNNMISIWVDPTELDEHFGPTPIYGLIVPDKMGHYGDDDWRDDDTAIAGMDDDGGLRGDGSLDDDADDRPASGTVAPRTSSGDDDADDRQAGDGTSTQGTLDDDDDDDQDDDDSDDLYDD
jgi:hypothetical protein